jgi:hypothetical protein
MLQSGREALTHPQGHHSTDGADYVADVLSKIDDYTSSSGLPDRGRAEIHAAMTGIIIVGTVVVAWASGIGSTASTSGRPAMALMGALIATGSLFAAGYVALPLSILASTPGGPQVGGRSSEPPATEWRYSCHDE